MADAILTLLPGDPRPAGPDAFLDDHCKPIEGLPEPVQMPCPFCAHGGSREFEERIRADDGTAEHNVFCSTCGAEGSGGETRLEAAIAWNARPLSPANLLPLQAVRATISLIANEEPELAGDVLRLLRDRLVA